MGGVGSGKSTVAALLAGHGVAVIDSDRLSRRELSQPDVVDLLVEWYGSGICGSDGQVRRNKLAEIVFGDPAERARLEGLLHPRIEDRRRQLMAEYAKDPEIRMIALDSPLLFEAGLDAACDAVIFVDSPREARLGRVRAERKWSGEELSRRENSQLPLDEKKRRADHIVINNSGLDDLRTRVDRLLSKLLAQATDA